MVRMVAGVSAMQYSAKELGPFLQLFDDQAPRRIESSHPMRRIQCTCATFEIGDLLRSGTTSHLTGTTQLTEVPDLNRSRSQE